MSTSVIYSRFRVPLGLYNRYVREIFEIWDADLHHGDVRPFACPEVICEQEPVEGEEAKSYV